MTTTTIRLMNYYQFSTMTRDEKLDYLKSLSRAYKPIAKAAFGTFLKISGDASETSRGDFVQFRDLGSIAEENNVLEVNSRLADLIVEGSNHEQDPKVKELLLRLQSEFSDYEQSLREELN